jgi:hypothetical protein
MTAVLGNAVLVLLSIACIRSAVKNWSQFRSGSRRPLLADVTTEQLTAIPSEWPLSKMRWPPPLERGKPAMEAPLAAAYARLAEKARRTSAIAAEVLAVVGSAWLGVRLDDIWKDYRVSSAEATRAIENQQDVPFLSLPEILHLLPVVLIIIAVMILVLARQYEVVQHCYEDRADTDREEPTASMYDQSPQRRSLRSLIRRYLSGGM